MRTQPSNALLLGVASTVRARIERGGERLWRLEDFRDMSGTAVAQALSRLTRGNQIERLSKGTYYRGRQTTFGISRPNPSSIQQLAGRGRFMFPAGLAAANLLGFTTQNPARVELATNASSLPRKLLGPDAVIHTRRPSTWADLSQTDAALLDFLRTGGRTSERSPQATIRRTLELLAEAGRYRRLTDIGDAEPPRVRALLGALGEHIGKHPKAVTQLRGSLNPLSRFDFGVFVAMPNAKAWQAKEPRS